MDEKRYVMPTVRIRRLDKKPAIIISDKADFITKSLPEEKRDFS